jgi:hypothetical protein
VRIFSGVYAQCEKMRDSLSREPLVRGDEGFHRGRLNKAIGTPLRIRHDQVISAIANRLMDLFNIDIEELTHDISTRLLAKQRHYGDTLEYPIRAFSNASILDHINLKIDDKLCIIYNSRDEVSEDMYKDVICYIIIYKTLVAFSDDRFYKRLHGPNLVKKGGLLLLSLIIGVLSCITALEIASRPYMVMAITIIMVIYFATVFTIKIIKGI